MQHPASELPRMPIPRTRVNRGAILKLRYDVRTVCYLGNSVGLNGGEMSDETRNSQDQEDSTDRMSRTRMAVVLARDQAKSMQEGARKIRRDILADNGASTSSKVVGYVVIIVGMLLLLLGLVAAGFEVLLAIQQGAIRTTLGFPNWYLYILLGFGLI
jgi:hypothetical protein